MSSMPRLRIIAVTAGIAFFMISLWQSARAGQAEDRPARAPLSATPVCTEETPAEKWSSLLQRQPFPYKRDLPPPLRTDLDGTYTKVDPKHDPKVPCRRCPDYAPEGGIWKIQFEKGVFRIIHLSSGWKSMASFALEEGRLLFFNDPVCHETVGVYIWKAGEGQLIFKAIEDDCAIRLRAINLTKQPWFSCRPPNTEAATTGHWPEPPGCQ